MNLVLLFSLKLISFVQLVSLILTSWVKWFGMKLYCGPPRYREDPRYEWQTVVNHDFILVRPLLVMIFLVG